MMTQHTIGFLLGQGSSAKVYQSLNDNNQVVKISKVGTSLQKEAHILSQLDGYIGFPKIYDSGVNQAQQTEYITMEKLGPSLLEFMTFRKNKLNESTIEKIVCQLLDRAEQLNSIGVAHNDIKPENVLFGVQKQRNLVHLIDFGMSSIQKDLTFPQKNTFDSIFKGNILFSSLQKMSTGTPTFLTDLEQILYLGLWMCNRGTLPWAITPECQIKILAENTTLEAQMSCVFENIQAEKWSYRRRISSIKCEGSNSLNKINRALKTLYSIQELAACGISYDKNIYRKLRESFSIL